jgi:hypothetical protein
MAKRAPSNEIAYSPLDITLAQSVVKGAEKTLETKTSMAASAAEYLVDQAIPGSPGASNGKFAERQNHRHQMTSQNAVSTRNLNREKRVLVTPEEERQIERLVDRIGEQLGTSLKLSHLLRACMALLCHAEEEIICHTSTLNPLPRPSNGDAVALAQFDEALARLLSKSLRDAPAIR